MKWWSWLCELGTERFLPGCPEGMCCTKLEQMMKSLAGTALTDYGARVFRRDNFTCVYCGFDGRLFDNWMQLSIDHVIPRKDGGSDDEANLVTACRACNSITSRMTFSSGASGQEIVVAKRRRVEERRKVFYDWWLEAVAPLYLQRPLAPIS